MKTFQCGCGFETHLVEINGELCYDEAKHGNGEKAECKCFNCGKVNTELAKELKTAAEKADADAEKARKAAAAKAAADAEKANKDKK
ncbi:MAG: hypothetical protein WCY59_04745 [Anaerovoracaceae bacterium]|jgi:hypothetical protein